ncbi:DCC1-like thiol-disulfide oxidoreductase family protein [Bacterioplanoides sp.]|uniref:DCC1-like thiol-disulfide oxidoreductase family protein n=1 Tax=Bacterioplanoides sp. TaxID=2066072 RepID=UPI003AFFF011
MSKPEYQNKQAIIIVYDGECPVCQHFVRGIRLRQLSGELILISAREQQRPEVQWLQHQGVNLNDNMAVIYGEQMVQGAAAITWLTAMSSPSHWLNRLLFVCFRNPTLGKILYPALRSGRLLLLRLLGRQPIQ